MKNKIYLAVIALAMFACGGATKESAATEEAADSVEVTTEEIVSEADTTAMAMEADSVEVAADSIAE